MGTTASYFYEKRQLILNVNQFLTDKRVQIINDPKSPLPFVLPFVLSKNNINPLEASDSWDHGLLILCLIFDIPVYKCKVN